ncbi:MAG TPA: DUF4286 family protein [Salinimicrobium sp.]|nr:DUF4286 family protein [Salinimicrobium sp.]
MYIFNVTTNVQEDIHDEWLDWMKNERIPEMLATGKFQKALLSRVLVNEEMGGITYSVQYTSKNDKILKDFHEQDAQRLAILKKQFEGKVFSFQTEMQVVKELFEPENTEKS